MAMLTVKNENFFEYKFIFRNNLLLLSDTNKLPEDSVMQKCIDFQLAKDMFSESSHNYTTLHLEENSPTPQNHKWVPLRSVFAENAIFSPIATRAIALLNWRNKTRFCSSCGSLLHDDKFETARFCANCGNIFFPTVSPAIIVIIEKEGKILLARHANRNTDIYTCLAGYLEPGESAKECVIREVKEEVGLEIQNIQFQKTQSWPFPDQFIIGFSAQWKSGEIILQREELEDAKWFDPDNLPNIPKPGSVAWDLINLFIKKK